MTVQISNPNPIFFDKDTNLPLSGGYLYIYTAGTTTPANTYSDSALTIPNANPIVLNSAGTFSTSVFFAAGSYKLVLYSAGGIATGTLQWTRDDYEVVSVSSFTASQSINAQTGTSYTIQTTDRAKRITRNNINTISDTLPQAGTNFPDGWYTTYTNIGAGIATITPATSSINGETALVLTKGQSALISSDGTNYWADVIGVPVGVENSWGNATPPAGYLICNNNTLGSATSGATKAHERYRALYVHLWNAYSDSYVPVSTGRGASGNADFDANKTLTMATMANMSIYGVGTLATGQTGGASTVASTGTVGTSGATTLTSSQIPSITSTWNWGEGAPANTGSNTYAGASNSGVTATIKSGTGIATGAIASNNTSGTSHTHTGGSYTGDATSVLHPVRGKYYIIKY
jgi:hypothetical protein